MGKGQATVPLPGGLLVIGLDERTLAKTNAAVDTNSQCDNEVM